MKHKITLSDETVSPITPTPYVFNSSIDSWYNDTEFKGLLIDSGTLTWSTDEINQLKALQQLNTYVQIEKNMVGSANFIFWIESIISVRLVDLNISLGLIIFHIVPVNTLFLLRLADIDKYGVFFNNITNRIIQTQFSQSHAVIQRNKYALLLWYIFTYTLIVESILLNSCYLMDVELQCLHRRFGHLLMHCWYQLLKYSGHNVDLQALQYTIKYCKQC